MTTTLSALWRQRNQVLRDLVQLAVCALACAWVAGEASYHAGRQLRAFLACLRASDVIASTPALAPADLRQALVRFLARRYGWRIA